MVPQNQSAKSIENYCHFSHTGVAHSWLLWYRLIQPLWCVTPSPITPQGQLLFFVIHYYNYINN